MAGLPSLMQQPGQAPQPGQAAPPGQAPMQPGMAPQQGAQTPGGVTGQLSQLQPQQLLSMYNNPQDMTPKWAVASAYAKAIEQQRQMQMAQGQTAMAQNAQQQQQLPVAQEVMSQAAPQPPQQPQQPPPVMAALGGLMRGYAGGGAVAFQRGGNVQHFSNGADEFGLMANPEATAMDALRIERAQKEKQLKALEETYYSLMMQSDPRAAQVKQQIDALAGRGVTPAAATTPSAPMRMQDTRGGTPEMAALAQMLGSGTATPSPSPAAGQRMPSAQPTSRPSTVGDAEMAALQQSLMNQQSNIRTLSQPSDEERLARQAARQAEADRLAQEREAARAFREASTKQYEDVQQRVNRPFLDNPAAIAAFGSMLSPERGQLASGMLKGLGALESSKQAQLDAARKEMRDDQRVAMQMESVNRQLEVARQEKLYADMQGDRQGSLAAAEKIAALQQRQSELVYGHAVKKEELRNQGMQAQAAMLSAGKPTTQEALRSWFEKDPKGFSAFIEAQNEPKSASAMRRVLMEQWSKNLMLQQKFPNFDDFVTTMTPEASAASSSAGEFKVLGSRPK